MANTTNLNLEKPIGTDQALVSVINSNMDKIDTFAGSTNQALLKLRKGAFCTTAAEVLSALDDAVSSDGNTVISISNSSKNDIFTASSNQTIVVVYLNEESVRWDDHPYFIMQSENGLWTGRIGKQSGAWAVQEIYKFALKSEIENLFYEITYDTTTSSTGAVNISANEQGHIYLGAVMITGGPGFVFRRDSGYLTVFNNSMQPITNTAVKFKAYYTTKGGFTY